MTFSARLSVVKKTGLRKLSAVARRIIPDFSNARNEKYFRMAVEMTNKCNFSCSYCPHAFRGQDMPDDVNRFDRPQGFISKETFELCLENAEKYAASMTFGFFGEQLLHPKFADLISSIPKQRSYRLIINTNGSLLTRKNIDVLKMFDLVRLSIDSMNSDSFETLRPGGAILTINGKRGDNRFETLREKIEYWFNETDHPQTTLVHVTTDENKDERQAYLEYWLPRIPVQDSAILKSVLSYGGVIKNPYMTVNPCTIPEDNRVVIAFNGDVTPCNLDVNVALKYGNINETPDLKKLIKSAKYKAVIKAIRSNQGICANCNDANNHVESMSYPGLKGINQTKPIRVLSKKEVIECNHRLAA